LTPALSLHPSRCDPTDRHRAAPWRLLRSCLPPRAWPGPGDLRCSRLGRWLPLSPVSLVSPLTAIRNNTIINNNISHPPTRTGRHIHTCTSRPPCTHVLTAAQSHGLQAYMQEANAANLPCVLSFISHCLQALAGLHPNQSCLMHTTARRHPRFSLLAACCEETLAISCMHNIFRICPATDRARLLHSADTASQTLWRCI